MWIDNYNLSVGDVGFLIEVSPQGRECRIDIRTEPGRTNMSNSRRLYGWLGETNNISKNAQGVGKVVRVSNSGERALVRSLSDKELAAALEDLGHPDMVAL